jgi:hypothetical protein
VAVRIAGSLVGTTSADDSGAFQAELSLPSLAVGRHEVVATCGDTILRSPIDIVVVTASNGAASSATIGVVLCFFVLFGMLVFRSPQESETPMSRYRP